MMAWWWKAKLLNDSINDSINENDTVMFLNVLIIDIGIEGQCVLLLLKLMVLLLWLTVNYWSSIIDIVNYWSDMETQYYWYYWWN